MNAADVNANGQSAAANVPRIEGARLVLELYQRRFEDKDGDPSDQPVTALTACEGSFSFVLVDKDRDAILIARSSESDTHPLFWGTAPGNPDGEDWDGSMLIAHTIESIDELCGGAAVAFPLGAFYYVDASMDYGVIQRMVTSAPKRKVKPLHRVNSTGQVCGLGFYTESGQNLASLLQIHRLDDTADGETMNAARDETRVRGLKRATEVSRERALRRFQSSNAPKLLL